MSLCDLTSSASIVEIRDQSNQGVKFSFKTPTFIDALSLESPNCNCKSPVNEKVSTLRCVIIMKIIF